MMVANAEGAVKAHWQVYPNSKPTGVDEKDAFAQAMNLVKVRNDFLKPEKGERWGEFPATASETMVEFMRSNKRIEGALDPKDLYTNQFVAAVNKFDAAAVQARAMSLGK